MFQIMIGDENWVEFEPREKWVELEAAVKYLADMGVECDCMAIVVRYIDEGPDAADMDLDGDLSDTEDEFTNDDNSFQIRYYRDGYFLLLNAWGDEVWKVNSGLNEFMRCIDLVRMHSNA